MKYYAHVPFEYSHHNKLDEAIKTMLRQFNDMVFEVKRLPVIMSSISNIVEQLNLEFKRCKPVEVKWKNNDQYGNKKKDDWFLYLSLNEYTCALKLILCKEEKDL